MSCFRRSHNPSYHPRNRSPLRSKSQGKKITDKIERRVAERKARVKRTVPPKLYGFVFEKKREKDLIESSTESLKETSVSLASIPKFGLRTAKDRVVKIYNKKKIDNIIENRVRRRHGIGR